MTRPADTPIRSTQVDRTSDDDLRITLYPEGGDMMTDAMHFVVPLGEALDLLSALATQTAYAVADASANIAAGDCPRCRNTRLVNEPKNGRDWNVHCPDCRPAFDAGTRDPFKRPRIGGGIR